MEEELLLDDSSLEKHPAITEQLEPASTLRRVLATGCDLWLVGSLWYIGEPTNSWIGWLFPICLCYSIVFEALRQQTVGKMLLSIKVVSREGHYPSVQQLVIRNLSKFILLLCFPILLLIMTLRYLECWRKEGSTDPLPEILTVIEQDISTKVVLVPSKSKL